MIVSENRDVLQDQNQKDNLSIQVEWNYTMNEFILSKGRFYISNFDYRNKKWVVENSTS